MAISVQPNSPALIALNTLNNLNGASNGAAAAPEPLAGQSDSQGAAVSLAPGLQGASPAADLLAGLSTAASVADTAVAAGNAISQLLSQLKQEAQTAADPATTDQARADLAAQYRGNLARISQTVAQAGFAGVNLLDGSQPGPLQAPVDASGRTVTLTPANLSLGGPIVGFDAVSGLSDAASASAAAVALTSVIANVNQAVGAIAAQGAAIQGHLSVVAQAGQFAPAAGVSPNLNQESALLMALQVQQSLSASGAQIGGAAPQSILSLFR
ncbi:MAG: hypothetical protein ACHP84_06550 [Caulobacterales bacterium]